MHRVSVIDSHTEGEPTRVVISGGPDLGSGTIAEQLGVFRRDHDWFRSAVVNEPRGNDAMVGALLCTPKNLKAAAGVIFFNNVGYLNACGHGSIGLAATLAYLGRIDTGSFLVETPVGDVTIHRASDESISIDNVASYRHAADVAVEFMWQGLMRTARGDIAWGGNWFFLVGADTPAISVTSIEELTAFSWAIRQALERSGITGANNEPIDHIELFGPPLRPDADSRNFVLCPGKAYDRSPCGTGTSAKMACLAADGKLKPGEVWRQESIIGSLFQGTYARRGEHILPTISGAAYITAEATLVIDPRDPFRHGIRV